MHHLPGSISVDFYECPYENNLLEKCYIIV